MLRNTKEVKILISDFIINLLTLKHTGCFVVPLFVRDVVRVLRPPALVTAGFVSVIKGLELIVGEVGLHEGFIAVLDGGMD